MNNIIYMENEQVILKRGRPIIYNSKEEKNIAISQYKRKWYNKNINKISKYNKKYYDDNREIEKKRAKEYYHTNNDFYKSSKLIHIDNNILNKLSNKKNINIVPNLLLIKLLSTIDPIIFRKLYPDYEYFLIDDNDNKKIFKNNFNLCYKKINILLALGFNIIVISSSKKLNYNKFVNNFKSNSLVRFISFSEYKI